MNLCNLRTIRELMNKYGLKFRHEFGQNFLVNPAIPARIADECCENPDSGILEIGPGVGCLTAELSARFPHVVAVEIDHGLISLLGESLTGHDNCTVIEGDIMKLDLNALVASEFAGRSVSVCANLPYYITTPILMKLLESRIPFDFITIMVQSEVADRLTAEPGSAEYGAITASLGYYGTAERLFTVRAGSFEPPPKVNSAVVRIRLHKRRPYTPKDEALFFRMIRAAFLQRRKTLVNALSSLLPEVSKAELSGAVESLGLRPDVRGERLSTGDFVALSDLLFERGSVSQRGSVSCEARGATPSTEDFSDEIR